MATFDDVRALALALPETSEGARWGNTTFFVRKAGFVWDRPLNKSDLAALVDRAPGSPGPPSGSPRPTSRSIPRAGPD